MNKIMPNKILLTVTFIFAFCLQLHPSDPFNYFVEVKNFNNNIYSEKTTRYRLTSSNEDFSLIATSYQKINSDSIKGQKKVIVIESGLVANPPAPDEELSPYLQDTRFLNLASPEITGAATKLRRSSDPVQSVEDYVFKHIADKTLGIPLVPAVDVYRMKRGDCTEHSVLAVALLRKLRIPARAVVGMFLSEGFRDRRNMFVFHMWAEAFVKGKWVLVDATRPGKKQLNRYIAFAYHNLKTEAPLPYLRAVSSIQDLIAEYMGR
jgi:transglutaminase-like putative cysteine protease